MTLTAVILKYFLDAFLFIAYLWAVNEPKLQETKWIYNICLFFVFMYSVLIILDLVRWVNF
jgi:hypothetical protein